MGRYSVAEPCSLMVDGRAVHYTRPDSRLIEVDDETAAPLVDEGKLTPQRPPAPPPAPPESTHGAEGEPVTEVVEDGPSPRRRGRPRRSEDSSED
ncbi:hypothetical protein DSM43518_02028 [Mycobacterium marinum]|uniref:hypothetical protein n=1 Tax=Mycobacterium marinum TaxID=1781 RepID=UPI000EC11D67|nr:hypothetical protein [Mycobacterium marinum]RFZ11188.1 hypothetical protein DSM43518_02028 [Mycobacterium marinum]